MLSWYFQAHTTEYWELYFLIHLYGFTDILVFFLLETLSCTISKCETKVENIKLAQWIARPIPYHFTGLYLQVSDLKRKT